MSEPLVFISSPRLETGPLPFVELENRNDGTPVITCFGYTTGGVVTEVRAAVLPADAPIPNQPDGDWAGVRPVPVLAAGEADIFEWRFDLSLRGVDNRLEARPGSNNRLVVLARYATGYRKASTIDQFYAGTTTCVPLSHEVSSPNSGASFNSANLPKIGSALAIKVSGKITPGGPLFGTIGTLINQTGIEPSLSGAGWTTKTYPGFSIYTDQLATGIVMGDNFLWVKGSAINCPQERKANQWPVRFRVT